MPIEVWDLLVDGVALYDVDRGAGFGAALGRAVELLMSGEAVSESCPRFPEVCRQIRRVVLAGGAAGAVQWRSTVPAVVAAEPERCGVRGGLAILAGRRGLVVDLGQSRLKVSGAREWVYVRDLLKIPVSMRPVEGAGRAALVEFVATGLREAAAECEPEAIVLALPCEIGDDAALGTCSYPWRAGDAIVEEVLAAAGLERVPTWLVNDAELAAIGVAADGVADTTLVLTLGFGVGGAVIRGA